MPSEYTNEHALMCYKNNYCTIWWWMMLCGNFQIEESHQQWPADVIRMLNYDRERSLRGWIRLDAACNEPLKRLKKSINNATSHTKYCQLLTAVWNNNCVTHFPLNNIHFHSLCVPMNCVTQLNKWSKFKQHHFLIWNRS